MNDKKHVFILVDDVWYHKVAHSYDIWGPMVERAKLMVYLLEDGSGKVVSTNRASWLNLRIMTPEEMTMIALKAVMC